MTDVTEDRDQAGVELSAADEQLLRELTERARSGGLKLTGEGGLLGKLTKMVIEGALEGELDVSIQGWGATCGFRLRAGLRRGAAEARACRPGRR
jgi:hypothetical protein